MRNSVSGPENYRERLEAFLAGQSWIPLSEQYPESGVRVLVQMATGGFEMGTWDAERHDWHYGPLHAWDAPVSWSPLPALHRTG